MRGKVRSWEGPKIRPKIKAKTIGMSVKPMIIIGFLHFRMKSFRAKRRMFFIPAIPYL